MRTFIRTTFRSIAVGALALAVAGCGGEAGARSHARAVYLLLDTSGTYREEIGRAQGILGYLLGNLNSGDSLGLARIDSESFSEKDVIARMTFDTRPSHANQQKRKFRATVDKYVKVAAKSTHTDITGGILQAAEWLNEVGAGRKYILIFSDLQEDLKKGYVRDFEVNLDNIHVVALNVTKLRTDQIDPREYMSRLANWEKRVSKGGGEWKVINDLDRLDGMLAG
jgi:hypothetical protein